MRDELIHGLPTNPAEMIEQIRSFPTPLSMVDVRPGQSGAVYYYLRHQYVTDVLNALCGYNWDLEVVREHWDPSFVTCLVRLTLRFHWNGQELLLVKEQWGGADIKVRKDGSFLDVSADFKAAVSDGKKKAAQEIGLGSDLGMPIRPNTLRGLHATGGRVFEKKWNDVRPQLVRGVTGGRLIDGKPVTSSSDLLDIEARFLMAAIDKNHEDHELPIAKGLGDLLRPLVMQALTG